MSKDNKPVGLESGEVEAAEKKAASSFKYIGPDYVKGIYIGRYLYDLKKFTREQAEDLIKKYPAAAKYFKL